MNSLFILLFLLSLGIFIWGLIRPSSFARIYKGKVPRRKVLSLHLSAILILLLILIGVTSDADTKSTPELTKSEQSTPVATNRPEPAPSPSPKAQRFYQVARVVDGDTVKVTIDGKIETIRLIGIDTPETVDPRKPVQCFGKEASDKAKELLNGKKVALETDSTQGDRDKYGRLLRYVLLEDGTSFNKLMIAEGYAHEYTYNSNPYKYQKEYRAAEKEARENERGLWSGKSCNGGTGSQPKNQSPQTNSVVDGTDYNCKDFPTQAAAQAYFDSQGGSITNNIDRLDGNDRDGKVCENNP